MLGDADVQFYRENGYLVVPDVVDSEQIETLRAATNAMVDESRMVTEHTVAYDLEETHSQNAPRVRRIKTPHKWHEAYDAMVRHPKIIACLEALIGPGIRFDTSKLNLKSERGGAVVEWHQDWAFYPHTNDDLCAVGIMLDDVDLTNGPLNVVAGSHKGPIYNHHADGHFCGAINDPDADAEIAKAVPITGRAGSISIHHVRILHGSAPNGSDRQRRLLLHQYRCVDAWPLHMTPDIAAFDDLIVTGEPTVTPRLAPVPVRLPFPPAPNQGSIYENQRSTRRRYFPESGLRNSA